MIEVVICTYNNVTSLRRVLDALALQVVDRECLWRIAIVDNNSSDETAGVAEAFVRDNEKLSARVLSEKRQGLGFARRAGVTTSDAEWVAFIDDDCVVSRSWVQCAADFGRTHAQAGAFGGRVELAWETHPDPIVKRYSAAYAEQELGCKTMQVRSLVGAGLVVRRDALLSSGWREGPLLAGRSGKTLSAGDDTEICRWIEGAAWELWYVPTLHLLHEIPARRIRTDYLWALAKGFGRAAPMLEGMVAQRSFPKWMLRQALRVVKDSGRAVLDALWLGKREAGDHPRYRLGIIMGTMMGLWDVAWMSKEVRASWFQRARSR